MRYGGSNSLTLAQLPIPATENRPGAKPDGASIVKTVDVENGIEELTDPDSLHEVLTRIGALDAGAPPLSQADLRRALAVREALRNLLHVNVGLTPDHAALDVLDGTGATGGLSVRFARDGTARLGADGSTLDGAFGRILAVRLHGDGGRQLDAVACPRDVCG